MKIARKAVIALSAMAAFAGPVTVGGMAMTAVAADTTKSVQVESDDTNLDEYQGGEVLTRDSQLGWQNWTFTEVGHTPEGTGIFTIKGGHFGLCIADAGVGNPVVQATCNSNVLSQRWVVDMAQEHTTIASAKNQAEVLQANGLDKPVTLNEVDGGLDQRWTLYDKQS